MEVKKRGVSEERTELVRAAGISSACQKNIGVLMERDSARRGKVENVIVQL